jgi:hypothetical protein
MKTWRTKRLLLAALLAVVAAAVGSGEASAATLTVCPSGCAFTQIAPALAAANNGDTVAIAAGTYTGGLTVDVSVKLIGAGAGRTIISGGGPVITIGQIFAASEPSVSIEGMTITGGVTRSSPESSPFTGTEGVWAAGGGIEIPPNADFSGGAKVTISNSVITGNRVAPTDALPFGPPCPGGGNCPFATAFGGGIDSWGTVSLANTTVSNNRVGSASGLSLLASDAEGAGIRSWLADLTISNSVVSGNQAAAAAPNGRFAGPGGIFFGGGTLTITNSSVVSNSATVTAALPSSVQLAAATGGVHIDGNAHAATINNSTISDNSATMTNSVGDATAFSAGLQADTGVVTLNNDVVTDNRVSATALGSSTGNGGVGEIGGTLNNVRLTGNTVDVSSATANATAEAGAIIFDGGTITNSLINNNHIRASAPLGAVDARGGAINVFGPTSLRNANVSGNSIDANGTSGNARGGGIVDVAFPFGPGGPPGGPLALQNSNVTGNTLSGSAAITLQGGGIFLQDEPVTPTNSAITHNIPDQCFGC